FLTLNPQPSSTLPSTASTVRRPQSCRRRREGRSTPSSELPSSKLIEAAPPSDLRREEVVVLNYRSTRREEAARAVRSERVAAVQAPRSPTSKLIFLLQASPRA
ncbi:putative histone lysine demethylase PHF8, partial [Sesbania bispinosa]